MPAKVHKTVVIDVVALTRDLVSPTHTPFLAAYLKPSGNYPAVLTTDVQPAFPAVTCTAQATYLTGSSPAEHGIVGNHLYDRVHGEHRNWHQSAALVRTKRLFERVKVADPTATTFSSFWWFPMGDRFLDYALTPRPQYLADGGKVGDLWTKPDSLRHSLQSELGTFPLKDFWGPGASIASTEWIVDATIRIDNQHDPTFTCVYLPHLDYSLQRVGPDPKLPEVAADLRLIDEQVRRLVTHYEARNTRVVILSEYGIQPVSRPVHINRVLRSAGLLAVRKENGGETLCPYASTAFAVVDHQIAHVYVNDQTAGPRVAGANGASAEHAREIMRVRDVLLAVPGVSEVLVAKRGEVDTYYDPTGDRRVADVDAPFGGRSGDLVVVADSDAWFTYYFWLDNKMAPDYAYTVNIHRKHGYDPVEMFYAFTNPVLGKLYLIFKLILVYLFRIRTIVDGTRFDAHRIRGSHGVTKDLDRKYWPVLGTRHPHLLNGVINRKDQTTVKAEDVAEVIWAHLTRE